MHVADSFGNDTRLGGNVVGSLISRSELDPQSCLGSAQILTSKAR
jgi:hypothetical protein